MSQGIDTRIEIKQTKCPRKECGKMFLKIYDNGTFHCTSCLMGGMICAKEYRYLMENKEIKRKVKNDYIWKTFVCENEKCNAIITEKPCKWCSNK